jgi:hypothetical protein
MATIAQEGNTFKIAEAKRIIANMTVFSPTAAVTKCEYSVQFTLAAPPTALVSSLTRVLPGGTTQSTSIVVSTAVPKASPVVVPLGVFPGRSVQYYVTETAGKDRTVYMTIESLDGSGANEVWRHQVASVLPVAARPNFMVAGPAAALVGGVLPLTIDSVDVTP